MLRYYDNKTLAKYDVAQLESGDICWETGSGMKIVDPDCFPKFTIGGGILKAFVSLVEKVG